MKIETDCLTIRPYRETDLEDALQFLGNPETMHYLPEAPFSRDQVRLFIVEQQAKMSYLTVELKANQKVIGHLFFEAFFGDHSYEIG